MKFIYLIFISLILCSQIQNFNLKGTQFEEIQKQIDDPKSPIEHIIVLCMENHSFDHMLGFMDAPIGTLKEENFCNTLSDGSKVCFQEGSDYQINPDVPHGFKNMKTTLYNNEKDKYFNNEPNMQGFGTNYEKKTSDVQQEFNGFSESQLPIISTLAKEFKTCTNWFASVPTCTYPNKYFFHAATAMGQTSNCDSLDCQGIPFFTKTIYDSLEEERLSWEVHWQDWAEIFSIEPLNQYKENIIYDPYMQTFYEQLNGEHGGLKNYTYIIPKAYWTENTKEEDRNKLEMLGMAPNTQHPMQDVRAGELLIKNVYEELRNSEYWQKSVLIITYDENGGFPDHVVPPGNVKNPNPEVESYPDDFNFNRLGLRVPSLVISPWIKKGVDDRQMEHASVPSTVKNFFNLPNYLNVRDTEANDIFTKDELLKEPRKDCPTKLPEIESFIKNPLFYFIDSGKQNPEIHLAGRLLIQYGYFTYDEVNDVVEKIDDGNEGMIFLNEAYIILGYRPMPKDKEFQFKYLENKQQQKKDIFQKLIE